MIPYPRVSIIIPSRTGVVENLKSQIENQTLKNWELIVIQSISPPARARNLGAIQAQGEYLIFLDDDIQFEHNRVLEELVEVLESAGPYDAVGVRWELPFQATWFQREVVRQSFRPVIPATDRNFTKVTWHEIGSACYGIKRAAFGETGGFQEDLISGEDYELGYRLYLLGGQVYTLTQSCVYHEPPKNLRELMHKIAWYERGNAQVARQYPESGYRRLLKNPWQAVFYLLLRTVCFLPLCFVKISFLHRRPEFCFRPIAALLSYYGAWVYCLAWFTVSIPQKKMAGLSLKSMEVLSS